MYINELLVLTKGDWKYHVHKSELTQNNLKEKGLKFSIEKFFFGQTEMEFLDFWVTRYVVKSIDKNTSNKI